MRAIQVHQEPLPIGLSHERELTHPGIHVVGDCRQQAGQLIEQIIDRFRADPQRMGDLEGERLTRDGCRR